MLYAPGITTVLCAVAVTSCWLTAPAALAQGAGATAGQAPAPPPEPADGAGDADAGELARRTTQRINMRLGAASTDHTGRPTICMEVRAVSRLSIESCGTGSGILHNQSGAEMAHFRAKWALGSLVAYHGLVRFQTGMGFAELQLEDDDPGFVFGKPRDRAIETAGPEAALTVQWLRPMGKGVELVASTTAGLAWFPYAGDLAVPQARVQPFVGFEAGIGW